MRMSTEDVVHSLRAEYALLHDLNQALIEQRSALTAGDFDAINQWTERIDELSHQLVDVQAWRSSMRDKFRNGEIRNFTQLLENMGVPVSDELVALAQDVRSQQLTVSRNFVINRTTISEALQVVQQSLQYLGDEAETSSSSGHNDRGIMFDTMA